MSATRPEVKERLAQLESSSPAPERARLREAGSACSGRRSVPGRTKRVTGNLRVNRVDEKKRLPEGNPGKLGS